MLTPDSATPLYLQLKTLLRDDILSGRRGGGEKIPTEDELTRQYRVSRVTVRKAVGALVEEGLLVRRPGKGTFVCTAVLQNNVDAPVSWTADVSSRNLRPSTRCVELAPVETEGAVLEKRFGIAPSQHKNYLRAQRLRLVAGAPVILELDHFPQEEFAFLTKEMMEGSVFRLLRQKKGMRTLCARDTVIRVCRADTLTAALLQIPEGEPMAHVCIPYVDEAGRVVFLSEQYIRSENYQIRAGGHIFTLPE